MLHVSVTCLPRPLRSERFLWQAAPRAAKRRRKTASTTRRPISLREAGPAASVPASGSPQPAGPARFFVSPDVARAGRLGVLVIILVSLLVSFRLSIDPSRRARRGLAAGRPHSNERNRPRAHLVPWRSLATPDRAPRLRCAGPD